MRHFTARICVTDDDEFAVSIRKENNIETEQRLEFEERQKMEVEEQLSRKAKKLWTLVEEQAGLERLREMKKVRRFDSFVRLMKAERRAANMVKKHTSNLIKFERKIKVTRAKENARIVAEKLKNRLVMVGMKQLEVKINLGGKGR